MALALSILQQYKDNHLDITSVKAKVASLFHRHTDLLHKFSIFLPEQESMDGEGAGDDADGGGGTKRYALNASHMH